MYLVQDGKAALKPIKIGQRSAGLVEVVEGLTENDVVITAGQIKIGPGMPVQSLGAAPAAASASTSH